MECFGLVGIFIGLNKKAVSHSKDDFMRYYANENEVVVLILL
jgi:hypothetical protein